MCLSCGDATDGDTLIVEPAANGSRLIVPHLAQAFVADAGQHYAGVQPCIATVAAAASLHAPGAAGTDCSCEGGVGCASAAKEVLDEGGIGTCKASRIVVGADWTERVSHAAGSSADACKQAATEREAHT